MLPLALGVAGALAKDQPLDPASWRTVHENLREKHTDFREMENGKLFSAIDASLCDLPFARQEQLRLMAVMASGVAATSEMLANLWEQVCWYSARRVRALPVADFCFFTESRDAAWTNGCGSHRRWSKGRTVPDSSSHTVLTGTESLLCVPPDIPRFWFPRSVLSIERFRHALCYVPPAVAIIFALFIRDPPPDNPSPPAHLRRSNWRERPG